MKKNENKKPAKNVEGNAAETEAINDEQMDGQGQGPEEFDITGSPAKPQEEQVELSTRGVEPTERRKATPDRAPAQKRRAAMSKDPPAKRLVIDAEETMESDHKAEANEPEETPDMQFENDVGPSGAGGAGSSDSMIGLLRGLNIVEITEVFFAPRVVKQGERLGLKPGSRTDLLTGWNS